MCLICDVCCADFRDNDAMVQELQTAAPSSKPLHFKNHFSIGLFGQASIPRWLPAPCLHCDGGDECLYFRDATTLADLGVYQSTARAILDMSFAMPVMT